MFSKYIKVWFILVYKGRGYLYTLIWFPNALFGKKIWVIDRLIAPYTPHCGVHGKTFAARKYKVEG